MRRKVPQIFIKKENFYCQISYILLYKNYK